ncbi:MAG TPA: response regulator [Myxococcaceae bacterium]|jgi:CheY-like chemotaxis protein
MAQARILLVDDSDAVLDFERAALSYFCACSVARNGQEALQQMEGPHRPDAVVLDLSMPGLTGEETLERMKADPRLRQVPVVVVSSEKERAERCLQLGAVASLPKPFTGEALLSVVLAAVEDARRQAATESAVVLPVEVGPMRLGLELSFVRSVASQPKSALLPGAHGAVSRFIELEGRPLMLLDLAARLGVRYRYGAADRMVVVVRGGGGGGRLLGASVDAVDIPEEVPREDVTRREDIGGLTQGEQLDWMTALVRTPRGLLPVLDLDALFRGDDLTGAAAALGRLEANLAPGATAR